MYKAGDFIMLAGANQGGNGLENDITCLMKINSKLHGEHFSFPEGRQQFLDNRRDYLTGLMDRSFTKAAAKAINLTDPEFIKIMETHTLVPEMLPDFAEFMRKKLVEQFGDKILNKPEPAKNELWQEAAGISVKETTEQLGFIRFNK